MSAGTRSSAITATAPASSAILACSAVTTSMITPPLSISAIPRLTRVVPVTVLGLVGARLLGHVPSLGLRVAPADSVSPDAQTAWRRTSRIRWTTVIVLSTAISHSATS